MPDAGTIETVAEDIGRKPADIARRWKTEIELAEKHFENWVKRGIGVVERYRDEKERKSSRFNMLWANTETFKPALYGKTPTPDVRRRITDAKKPDPVGKAAAMVLERALSQSIDDSSFHAAMLSVVEDFLLPGRGAARVKYIPTMAMGEPPRVNVDTIEQEFDDFGELTARRFMADGLELPADGLSGLDGIAGLLSGAGGAARIDMGAIPEESRPFVLGEPQEEVVHEEARCVYLHWRDRLVSPARDWSETRWIAYRSRLTRDELKKQFPEHGAEVLLDWTPSGLDDATDDIVEMFKKATVWEIWDRESRAVVVIAKEYAPGPLAEWDDPLGLKDFFPEPEPIDFVTTNDSNVPIPLFTLYQDQADELDKVTARIDKLIGMLKVRGVYDGGAAAVAEILKKDDGVLVAVDNYAELAAQGGLERIVSLMPLQEIAGVLAALYNQRGEIKQTIFEIIGLSDILRGSSDPDETARAQSLKAQFGTLRQQNPQDNVQRFARDLLRLKAEIMAEHFSQETLAEMSGVELPSAEEKAQAEQLVQMASQAQGNPQIAQGLAPLAAQAKEVAGKPSWDEVMTLLRDDGARGFRIDIETDSTVVPDAQAEQRNRTEFLTALTGLAERWLPAVQGGIVQPELFKAIVMFAVRGFKVGREIEEELETLGTGKPQPQPGADEAAAKAKAEAAKAQIEAAKLEFEKQKHTEATQAKREETQAKLQLEAKRLADETETKQLAETNKMDALALERLKHRDEMQAGRDKLANEAAIAAAKLASEERIAAGRQQGEETARGAEAARPAAQPVDDRQIVLNLAVDTEGGTVTRLAEEKSKPARVEKLIEVKRDAKGDITGAVVTETEVMEEA